MSTSSHNSKTSELSLYCFGEDFLEKSIIKEVEEIKPFLEQERKFWLNVPSIKNSKAFDELAVLFNIHPLALEDIKNKHQRPKIEEFEDFILVVTKMVYTKTNIHHLEFEQVSFLFGKNFIVSFQENSYDIFDPIRLRLQNPNGRMRKMGTDYFTYTLLDAIVDEYYIILELMDNDLEKIENHIIHDFEKVKLADIYQKRKALQEIKKIIWPTRELIAAWRKMESPLIKRKTNPFITDLYEHTVEIMDNLELHRESITTMVEIFMSNISLKQNEVMKTLTIIATIFIPLTFIAGVYGMNFHYMPEIKWPYGYFVTWGLFISVTVLMLFYFKRKKYF